MRAVGWLSVALLLSACGPVRGPGTAGARPPAARRSTPPPSAASAAGPASAGGSSAAPAGPPLGTPAAAFASVLPALRGLALPVYLPGWLPPPPAGEAYDLTTQAGPASYEIRISQGTAPAAAQGVPAAPAAAQLGAIVGGTPASLPRTPAFAPPAVPGQAARVGSGTPAAYYAQGASGSYSLLQWTIGGWRFQVADTTGLGASAAALTGYADSLLAGLRQGGDVVPDVPSGAVVETITPDGAPAWVLWRAGPWSYQLEADNLPALRVAASMVRTGA